MTGCEAGYPDSSLVPFIREVFDPGQILGGNAGDLIVGDARVNDVLRGQAGDDTLSGGPGADQLLGLDGNDWSYAFDNAVDTVDGGRPARCRGPASS